MQAVAVGGALRRNGGALEHAATHGYTSGSSTNRRIQMTNGAGAMPIYDRVLVRSAAEHAWRVRWRVRAQVSAGSVTRSACARTVRNA
jgi:hypothetical protein